MSVAGLSFTRARAEHLPRLEEIRAAAIASFRAILGDELYALAQAPDDAAQPALLASMLRADSGWELYVVERRDVVLGFVSVRLDHAREVGEIGLNAVHPDHAGSGIGTTMYELAIARMREAGMRAATVSTGGDPRQECSHAQGPQRADGRSRRGRADVGSEHARARRAYEKAGVDVQIPSVWMCRSI